MRKLPTYLVEDNATIRVQLIDTLAELAQVDCVGHADNEQEAIAWMREHPDAWQLALVDLFLRGGSGVGVVAALADRQAQQKVVVISNYASKSVTERCLALGCDAVFDKSGDIDKLVQFCQAMRSAG